MQKTIHNKKLDEFNVKFTHNEQGWWISFEPHKSFSYYGYSFLIWLTTIFMKCEIKIAKMYRHLKRTIKT